MSEVLQVTKRETRGKRNARRQRATGRIPAILYGHGRETISLHIDAAQINAAVRHGSRIVDLQGDVNEQALIREIQWDTFGTDVLHVDLTRVAADEMITVNVAVELRGVAPGTREGGVVEHQVHEVEIECPAHSIPEKLQVSINELGIGNSLTISQLELPAKAKLSLPGDTVVVQCVEAQAEFEEEAAPLSAEPEVIGRKAAEEEDAESR